MERTGSIYVVRNTVNDKVYVGQTVRTVKERWNDHLKPTEHKRHGKYKLYRAMNKYGADKFYVSTLEENIPLSKLNEKEIEYIKLFDSYRNGYNSTTGGDGRILCTEEDVEKIISLFHNGTYEKEIAEMYGVHVETIRRLLHGCGVYKTGLRTIQKSDLEEDIFNGMSVKELADKYQVSTTTIARAKRKYGLRHEDVFEDRYHNHDEKIREWHKKRVT